MEWSKQLAPSLDELETLADAAFAALPEDFRKLCEGLVIRVEDFPSDDVLEEMKCETEFDLLGLFQGRGLAHGETQGYTGAMPNMIWLYRRPILDYWAITKRRLAPWSPMCSFTRSAITSASPTRIWTKSKSVRDSA